MKEKYEVLVGADPELFVFDTKAKTFLSAHDLLPGTKANPKKVPRGAVQVDGLAAEFNITPARSQREFLKSVSHVRNLMEMMVRKKNKDLRLIEAPSAMFDAEYFASLPFDVLLLGCDPDYNAYNMMQNMKPSTHLPLRTGSGHVHIGFTKDKDTEDTEHTHNCAELVRFLDFALVSTSKLWDTDTQRQTMYGHPGSFRPKKYGVEYRVLSNAWLAEEWSIRFVYDTVKGVTMRWMKGWNLLEAASKAGLSVKTDNMNKMSEFMLRSHLPAIYEYCPNLR